jgi:hypothetical protein
MKQKLRLFSTLLLLAVVSAAWGEQTTVTASKVASSSASWTGSGGETWSVAVTGGATNQNLIEGYAQVGTKSSPSTSITFSTSGISGTITSVVIDCASYSGKATVSCTIGGTAFGTQSQSTPSWSNSSGGEVTFEGNASGSIVLTMTNGDGGRAMYVKSITVVYEENTSGKTTATLTFEDLPEGEVLVGHEFDIKVSTNSDAVIQSSNLSTVFFVRNFNQETGIATIGCQQVGTGSIKFFVEENDTYTAAERTLTFTSRKDNTSIVFDDTRIKNTDIAVGTEAGQLVANMKRESDGQIWISSYPTAYESFTFTTNDENVATITADGTITLVGAGTVLLTAKYNGSTYYAESPVATYELTVTNSDGPVIRTATFDFVNDITDISSPITREEFTATFDKGSGTTNPTYNTNSKEARLYAKGTLTISAPIGKTISKIVYNYVVNPNKNGAVPTVESVKGDTEDGTWNGDGKTWTGSANTVTMTLGGSAGNFGFKTITVTYEEADQTISVAPQISGEESFLNETTVTITAAEGAAIYYTIDGTDPTTSSTQYSAPFTLDATTTVKAIAVESGKTPSEVAKKTFTKQTVMTVAEAIAYIETLGDATSEADVYVSGIVSQVDGYNSNYHSITYWISDDGTTDSQMEVYSGKGLNGANFNAVDELQTGDEVVVCGKVKKHNGTPEFDYNNYLVSLTANRKQSTGLNYTTTAVTKYVGDANFTNELTNPNNLAVTYDSSDKTVATVADNGEVTILAAGTTTITASYEEDETYLAGEASYTLTVNETFQVEDGVFDFVAAGGANYDYNSGVKTTTSSNYYEESSSTWTAGNVTLVADGKYRWWNNDKTLRFQKGNGSMTISVPDGKAITSIVITGGLDWTANVGNYGEGSWTGSSQTVVFTAGTGSGNNVKKVVVTYSTPEVVTATISAAGYATFANAQAVDFSAAEDLTVLTAKYNATTDKIDYTVVTSKKVPAGKAVVLKGAQGEYNGTVIATADALENNGLKVNLTENLNATGKEYCLANKNGVVGFYKVATTTYVKAGKAYLEIERTGTTGGAKDFYAIEDETDGINAINNSHQTVESVYNLSGQRVNKAQKGIYIVNGKKVVVR